MEYGGVFGVRWCIMEYSGVFWSMVVYYRVWWCSMEYSGVLCFAAVQFFMMVQQVIMSSVALN